MSVCPRLRPLAPHVEEDSDVLLVRHRQPQGAPRIPSLRPPITLTPCPQIKKDTQSLKFLLQKKGVAFEEVDMAQMDKAPRDKVRILSLASRAASAPSELLPLAPLRAAAR